MNNKRSKTWKNGRIAYFQVQATAGFWDDYWENLITKEYYQNYEQGDLDQYSCLEKYLHKDDLILEAGCGTARFIVALKARGFQNIEGIDWGRQTIGRIKTIYPNLPIRVGDAANVDVSDNYYDGYISLGVVEHREEGPELYLNEAHRILKPGGYAFISVPFINSLRNLKRRLGFYGKNKKKNQRFYQYAFNKAEFQNILTSSGFAVIESQGIDGAFGLRDELPDFFKILDRLPGSWRINRYLKRFDRLSNWGHTILFVCRKKT